MTLCYSLGPSCSGGLDIIHIPYTILTGGLYDILFFGIFTFWVITAARSQCGCSYFVCILFISLSIIQWKTSKLMARTFSFKFNPKQPISMVKAHFVLTMQCFIKIWNKLPDLKSLNLANLQEISFSRDLMQVCLTFFSKIAAPRSKKCLFSNFELLFGIKTTNV